MNKIISLFLTVIFLISCGGSANENSTGPFSSMSKFRKALKSAGYECLEYEKMYPMEEGDGGLLTWFIDVKMYDNSIEGGTCTIKFAGMNNDQDSFLLAVWKDIDSSDSLRGRLNARCSFGDTTSKEGVVGAQWSIEGTRPGLADELASVLKGNVVHVDC